MNSIPMFLYLVEYIKYILKCMLFEKKHQQIKIEQMERKQKKEKP